MGCREGLPDSGSSVCRMWMGLCNLPHGLPVFCRCGPTCAPVTGTAEHDPAAIWSSFSSPLQKFLPIFCPLFQQHNPPPPCQLHFRCQLKSHFPSGVLSRLPPAWVPTEPALPISRHVTLTSGFPSRCLFPKAAHLSCPCVSPTLFGRPGPEQKLHKDLVNSADLEDPPPRSAGKMAG